MNRTGTARRRAQQLRRSRSRNQSRSGEDRAVARLVICGVVFVLLVAVKLLFPEAVGSFARSAGQLLGRNADFKEAFAAMGRAISGEDTVGNSLQDAYTAVFKPESRALPPEEPEAQPEPAARSGQEPSPADQGGRLVSYITPVLPEAGSPMRETVWTEDTAGEEPDTAVDTLSRVYAMPAPPENASLEQRNLGFDHATPVAGVLSSTFGWREHPVEGGNKFHYGVDLAADEGTAITAFADGTVYATGESSTLGNYIMLRHEGGYLTLYGHCSRITATGGSVSMGDKIAEVGSTGLTTGPHLHFELHDGDLYLNPIFYVEIG